jgi:predicted DNA binding CopG/RHH family protein
MPHGAVLRDRNPRIPLARRWAEMRAGQSAFAARGQRDDKVKVSLSLSRRSIDVFKREAKSRRVPYQKMIRALVDGYVERQAR